MRGPLKRYVADCDRGSELGDLEGHARRGYKELTVIEVEEEANAIDLLVHMLRASKGAIVEQRGQMIILEVGTRGMAG